MTDDIKFNSGAIKAVECYKEAWAMIKDQYWVAFGVVLVGLIVGSLVPLILVGPMICGIYMCLFDRYEGQPMSFDKLFKGFDFFWPGLVLTTIIMIPIFVMIVLMYVPMIGMAMAGQQMGESELMAFIIGVLVIELIFAVIMVCIHTLLMFAFPLMADKKLGAIQSIKLSVRSVWSNMSGVVGLFVVGFGVSIVGYLMLCIGIYLVIPLIFAANVVAYRKVFPGEKPSMMPPPPSFYQG